MDTEKKSQQNNLHFQLILAGLEELNRYGLQNFSVRRIAAKCGVSCAAPYKHFADKHSFIASIIEYVNTKWNERQEIVLEKYPSPVRKQLLEISLEYIRFLVENSYFRAIIMAKDDAFDKIYGSLRGRLTMLSAELIGKYCEQVGMPPEVRTRKTFVVRSLIYGAALMFDNGELPYTPENMAHVAYSIDREFDLA
jgi:AcrR family transcriptional regulator